MLSFSNSLSIHICARSDNERERWAKLFGRLFGNFTRVDAIGGWVGEKYVETEPVIIITRWLPDDWEGVKRFVKYATWFKQAAEQEAIAFQIVEKGVWSSRVVFSSDWVKFTDDLLYAFDKGEFLCKYFCGLMEAAESPETGCVAEDQF